MNGISFGLANHSTSTSGSLHHRFPSSPVLPTIWLFLSFTRKSLSHKRAGSVELQSPSINLWLRERLKSLTHSLQGEHAFGSTLPFLILPQMRAFIQPVYPSVRSGLPLREVLVTHITQRQRKDTENRRESTVRLTCFAQSHPASKNIAIGTFVVAGTAVTTITAALHWCSCCAIRIYSGQSTLDAIRWDMGWPLSRRSHWLSYDLIRYA